MSTDIKIRKKIANGYETFYPTNNAHNVIRNTNNFNYIDFILIHCVKRPTFAL